MNPERIWSWRMASQGTLVLGTAIAVACSQKTVIDPVAEEVELVDIAVLPRVADLTPNESQKFQAQGVTQAGTTVPTTVRWDAEGGTIDGQGMFVAASDAGEFSVTATHTVRSWLSDTVSVNITTTPGVVDLFVVPQTVTILVDDSTDFEAHAIDALGDTVDVDVTWETDGGASVQGMGINQARFRSGSAAGTHLVIARDSSGQADTATVTVSGIPVASVQVTPSTADLVEGESVQLAATMRDGGGNILTNRVVTWSSDAGTVATVDGSGVVAGLVAGTATISATSEGQTGTATVTVTQAPVASVSVSPSNLTVLVGRTAQLLATPRDAAGRPLTGRAVTWSSSDAQVVTVDGNGVATSVTVGTATVTATSEGQSGAASFTASDVAVATVEVSPQTASLVEGESAPLTAITRDEFGTVLADRFVTWSSSATGVATVDAAGVVTAVGAGTATIAAVSEGQTGTATITVAAAAVASVDVTPGSATLAIGETVQLAATPRDAAGNALSGRPVTWASSNQGVATVTATGLVTAVGDGIVGITATSEGQTGGSGITVLNPAVALVEVAPTSATLLAGETVQLTATPRDASGNALTGRTVTWSSEDTSVATINGSGVVTAVAAGSAVITATSEGVDGTATVTVSTVPVDTVAVTPGTADLVEGDSVQLAATPRDAAGNALTGRTVTWSSGDPSVATVNGNGLVTAVSAGSAVVTATSEGVDGTATVTVSAVPVAQVDVAPDSATLAIGETVPLTATPRDAGGNALTGRTVAWTSSDPAVATVNGSGLVTAVVVGSAVITATSEGMDGTATVTVSAVPVASVDVAPDSATLAIGDTVQLTATPRDAGGNALTGRPVTWSTEDPGVATVNASGLVTSVASGSAVITATSEGVGGTTAVTVSPASVTTVDVTPGTANLIVGETAQLTATPRDAAGNALNGRAVTWSSANGSVATVSVSGLVTAVAAGSAVITATSEGVDGTATVTVSPVPVTTVDVTPGTADLLAGETVQLSATPRDAGGNALTGRSVTWSSGNTGGATVNGSGLVTAVAAGSVVITATSEGVDGTATVTVSPVPVTTVDVTPGTADLLAGETVQLSATPRDAGGNALTGRSVTWSSGNTGVATVNGSGLVTAVAAGSVVITATSEGVDGTATVTVSPVPVTTVDVTPGTADLLAGETVQLSATPRDAGGNALTGRSVTWSSGNTGVATVNGSGLVTAVAAGSVVITATSEGVDGTATVTVSPVPVATVDVTPGTADLLEGETVQLTATPRDASGNVLTGRTVTWSSGNTGVATVNGTGLVTAGSAGSTAITATSEGVNGTATVTVSAAGVGSVVVTPSSSSLQVGATVQLSATVFDAAGNPMPGNPVTWSSSNGSLASVNSNGLVSANAQGSVTILATSEGVDGAATVTVNDGVRSDLAEPAYDPNNSDHVLHFYDNFANYATTAEMEQTGTNPDRVGGTWTLRGYFNGGFDEADPYTGEQSVRITYVPAGSERRNDGGIAINPPDYVNDTGNEEVVVIEYAYREVGQNTYQGKILDFNAGQNSIGRFDYNNGVAWEMGGTSAPTCSADPLCSRYYAGNDDGNLTPRFAGLPPEAGHHGGDAVRHVQLRTDGSTMPAYDPNGSVTAGYRQNRNWGMGAGQYDLMNNRDMRGQGNSPTQMPWMVIKIRFTKEASGWSYGQGRIEHWTGETPGALTKVVEYLGDPGEFDEGLVYVGPRNEDLLGANVNVLWPQGIGGPPNTSVLIGYVRVWSHPRF